MPKKMGLETVLDKLPAVCPLCKNTVAKDGHAQSCKVPEVLVLIGELGTVCAATDHLSEQYGVKVWPQELTRYIMVGGSRKLHKLLSDYRQRFRVAFEADTEDKRERFLDVLRTAGVDRRNFVADVLAGRVTITVTKDTKE